MRRFMLLHATVSSGEHGVPIGAVPVDLDSVHVEVSELTESEVTDAGRNPAVLSIAPPMPLSLIKPLVASTASVESEKSPKQHTWGLEAIGAIDCALKGNGVTVAVLDTGIVSDRQDAKDGKPKHPGVSGVRIVAEKNFTSEPSMADNNGHGTHCLGTICGGDIDGFRIGVAPAANAIVGKVLGAGGGSTDSLASAIEWAASKGANIVSLSLGMDFPGYQVQLKEEYEVPGDLATSMALTGYLENTRFFATVADYLLKKDMIGTGCLIVSASGNESRRDEHEDYWIRCAPPAAADGIVSVGAVGRICDSETRAKEASGNAGLATAWFSNGGARFVAPGVSVRSAGLDGGLSSLSGTSMATPHVAGAAALWAELIHEEDGLISATQVKEQMQKHASTLPGVPARDARSGLVKCP